MTENKNFNVEKFIPLLKERIYVLNPFVRQFLIGWIDVLDSVPGISLFLFSVGRGALTRTHGRH